MENNDALIKELIADINGAMFNRKYIKAYSVKDVDDFLDEIISELNNLYNNKDLTYDLKKIEYMINEKEIEKAFPGYNAKEVEDFFGELKRRRRR